MKGIDFSWARPGGAAIVAAGFEFVMRYCPYAGDGGKGLTVAEVADYRANGLAIGLVFESTAGRMLDGQWAGQADALTCAQSAAALGFPAALPIYFACDFDAQSGQYAALDAYLAGAASVLGANRVGIYAGIRVIEHCHDVGSAAWFWQTYAWSYGQVYAANHVYQYLNGQVLNGGAVDYCDATGEGLWKAQEEDMTEEQLRTFRELWRRTGGDAGNDFDLLQSLQNTQAALTKLAEKLSAAGQGMADDDRAAVADALEAAAAELRR